MVILTFIFYSANAVVIVIIYRALFYLCCNYNLAPFILPYHHYIHISLNRNTALCILILPPYTCTVLDSLSCSHNVFSSPQLSAAWGKTDQNGLHPWVSFSHHLQSSGGGNSGSCTLPRGLHLGTNAISLVDSTLCVLK